ncbi:hypothetical protein LTR41_002426 [Exophiala xenobiotica]|nr:hypothetical protein LTR41_002426 [Exophiala xenobiotica]
MADITAISVEDVSQLLLRVVHGVQRQNVYLTLAALTLVFLAFLGKTLLSDPRRKHMPPAPPAFPIINHSFYHMKDDAITNAVKWARKYGEIYRTRAGATDFIWLNSPEAVKEIIDRKSAIYSSRPPLPMASESASGGRRVVNMPHGNSWRTIRTILHRLLTPAMSKSYAPVQLYEAKQLSVDILDNPKDTYMHNRRYTSSLIMQITYGRRLPQWEHPDLTKIFQVLQRFGHIRRPGNWLVDSFPALANYRLFDLVSNWRTFGAEIHREDSEVWMFFWRRMQAEIDQGTAPHSFGKAFMTSDWQKKGIDELQAAYVLGTMIEAGAETTSIQLNNLIVGVLSRGKEVQQRAHEELDRVIGKDRTPTFEDEENLPYIRAMVKELMRWRAINKFGTNHYAMQDGWYKGYFIPKGSVVMINTWGIHYNPKRFPEPEKYEPMRFFNHPLSAAEATTVADPEMRDHYAYGGGRRICPGMHVAERSLFINVARLMWGFDLQLAKDENGRDIPVDPTFTTGYLPGGMAIAKPFVCDIRPRSPHHADVLRRDWEEAQAKGLELSHVNYRPDAKSPN